MTQLADAVDAINRYTGTDAETERILDLALPTMQYHANRFHYYHSRLIIDVCDLVAYQQIYLLQWLKGERPDVINQSFLSGILYKNMITAVRLQYRDFRQTEQYYEFVNQCFVERNDQYLCDFTMSDIRFALDELDVKPIVKDVLFRLLIEQYEFKDVKDYYNLSVSRLDDLYNDGMQALCSKLGLPKKSHYFTPVRHGRIRRKLTGTYVRMNNDSQIVADYMSGMKMATIVRKYGRCQSSIVNVLKRNGIALRSQIVKFVDHQMIQDYQAGMSYAEIGEKYKRNRTGIFKILKKHGIKPNRRRGKKAA